MTSVRVLLADDHAIVRQGVRRIVEEDPRNLVVAEASSGIEAVQLAERHQPDVAILDIAMQELNGFDAAIQIQRCSPHTGIMMLTMYDDDQYIVRAMSLGVRGYLMKDVLGQELLHAIQIAYSRNCAFSPSIARKVMEGYAKALSVHVPADRYATLTDREHAIYQMLAEGKTNKCIASRLNISVHTVETHRVRVMQKLNLHNIAELVIDAVRRGIVK